MRKAERGFALMELLITSTIVVVIGVAVATSIFQIQSNNNLNNAYLTRVNQLEFAGNQICQDVQSAETMTTEGLTYPDFFILSWDERGIGSTASTVNHMITYYFSENNLGMLYRNHWSSSGTNETILVGKSLYYDPDDTANTSSATYTSPTFTVKLAAVIDNRTETREYIVERRPSYGY